MNYNYNYDSAFGDDAAEATAQAAVFVAGQQHEQLQIQHRAQALAQQQQRQQHHHRTSRNQQSSGAVANPNDQFQFQQQIPPPPPQFNHQYAKPQASIFVTLDNKPIPFFIPFDEPDRTKYRRMIIQNGGYLAEGGVENMIYVTSKEHLGGFVRINYIDDCIGMGQLLPPGDYTISGSLIAEENEPIIDMLGLEQHGQQQQQQQEQQLQQQQQFQQQQQQQQQQRKANEFVTSIGKNAPAAQGSSDGPTARRILGRHASTSNRFTDEKDEYILDQVRKNPRLRHSHAFYRQLATHEMLKMHTGNSIRARYRRHLAPRLDFVYKTNDQGKLLKDRLGNFIPIPLDEILSETIKTKFTAMDDYVLCTSAVTYIKQQSILQGFDYDATDSTRKTNLPYLFFNSLYHKRPNHTLHSWRDRCRRYIGNDLDCVEYKQYYESCVANNDVPHVLSKVPQHVISFHKDIAALKKDKQAQNQRNKENEENKEEEEDEIDEVVDDDVAFVEDAEALANEAVAAAEARDQELQRQRKQQEENEKEKEKKKDQEEESALDEEIGELKSSNIGDAIDQKSSNQKSNSDEGQNDGADMGIDDVLNDHIEVPKLSNIGTLDEDEEEEDYEGEDDEEELVENAQKQDGEDSDNDVFFSAPTRSETLGSHRIESQLGSQLGSQTQQEPNDTSSEQEDDYSDISLAYLDKFTPLINCIDPPQFLKLLKQSKARVILLTELLNEDPKEETQKSSSSLAEDDDDSLKEIYSKLTSLGFKAPFIGHIIYACSNETLVMINYMTQFIDSLFQAISESEKKSSKKNKKKKSRGKQVDDFGESFNWETELIDPYLPFKKAPVGSWNQAFDAVLGTDQESKLYKFKSGHEIEQRKKFIASCLDEGDDDDVVEDEEDEEEEEEDEEEEEEEEDEEEDEE